MSSLRTTNFLLAAIALLLLTLALRPMWTPAPVMAQTPDTDYFFEQGTFMVKSYETGQQSYSKIVVDVRNGRVWAFPTISPAPFPVDPVNGKPQTSHPFQIGRFALEDTKKFVPDDAPR